MTNSEYAPPVVTRFCAEALADAVEAFAAEVCERHGVPDIVVNNAGVGHAGFFLDTPADEYDRVLDINFGGVVNGCLAFDVCSGKFHRIGESAAFVISELKRQTPFGTLIASYSQRYEISPAIAARDIELFLNDISVVR